jgi:Ca-activated chloride channel family protein
MQFLWPDLLLALLLLPLLALVYYLSQRRRQPSGVRYSSLSLIREARPGSSRLRRHLPFALLLAAFVPMVLALARPVAVVAVPTNRTTIILTIDVSGSMCSTDIPPTRLQAAEAAAAQFINSQSASTQVGLVVFSTFAEMVQAPTSDRQQLLTALASLTTGRRTAIGDGILASIDAISTVDPSVAQSISDSNPGTEPAPVPKGDYAPDIVVLLTDGASNTGTDPFEAAQQAADRGVRVYTIGFGTANGGAMSPDCAAQFIGREPGANGGGGFGGGGFGGGGFGGGGFGGGGQQAGGFRRGIDEAALQRIADMTGGAYYPAESASQLESVFAKLPTNLIIKHESMEISVVFAGLGAALAAMALLLGRLWRPLP